MLRLVSAVALLAVVAAGCGGATRARGSSQRGVPRALAQRWERDASAIATAAAAGDDCTALRLAGSLRNQVVAAEREVPLRLRSPLLTGVNRLADRITCTPPPPGKTQKPPKPPHDGHGHHGHHKHGGDGNEQ